jgi:hypothetical protein
MKNLLLVLTAFSILSCNAQESGITIKFDSIPFDLNSGNVSQDTLFMDLNGDGFKDVLMQFDYRNFNVNIPNGNSRHELAIYLFDKKKGYVLKNINRKILWVNNTRIFGVDSQTFCIVNEESGHDPNNYYCYFKFDNQRNNWYLFKSQIRTLNTGEDVLVKEEIYKNANQIPFQDVSFDILFGKIHNGVQEPIQIKIIKISKSIIFSKPNKPTKMYLIKGEEIEILKEDKDWFKFLYYNQKSKKTIEGWIKKTDVE